MKLTPFSSAALHSSQSRSPSSARLRRRRGAGDARASPWTRLTGRAEPAAAELGKARIGNALVPVARPVDRQRVVALDRDRPAQAVDRQALDQVVRRVGLAIEQQVVLIRPDQEIEQAFALRRQQSGPDRQVAGDILVTSPWRKPRTSSPDRRMTARSVRVVAGMALAKDAGVTLQTIDHPPPRRLARPSARRRDAEGGRALHRAAVRAGDRHAQSGAAGDHAPRRQRPIATGSSRPRRPGLHAADDLLSDRRSRSRTSSRAGFEDGVWIAAKLYPAGATTNSAAGVTDIRNIHPALERMQQIGMVLCVHGEVTDPDVDVFDREAVFIDRVLAPLVRDFPGAQDRVRAYHHRRGGRVRRRQPARMSPRRSRRSISSSTAMRCSTAAFGRTPIACRSPSARSIGWRCARRRRRARPNFSSAPTARRMRAKPRNRAAAAPASSTRRSRSKAMRRCSRRRARSTGSKPSPRNMAARFYGLPLNEGSVTLERSVVEVPEDDRRRCAVPRRRDAALADGRLSS